MENTEKQPNNNIVIPTEDNLLLVLKNLINNTEPQEKYYKIDCPEIPQEPKINFNNIVTTTDKEIIINNDLQIEPKDIKTLTFKHNSENEQEFLLKNLLGADKENNKKETIYNKLINNICINDTANINFNKYSETKFKLLPISDIYSDNILLGCVIPIQETQIKQEEESKENNNRFIKYYRNIIINFLFSKGIKGILPKNIKLAGIRKADGKTGHIK